MAMGSVGRKNLWCALVVILSISNATLRADEAWRVGVGKVDITPEEPVRLSGYAVRVESSAGVADPIAARAMVISPANAKDDSQSLVLVSIDAIGVSSAMTVAVSHWLEEQYVIPRSQLAISSTHSHSTPHQTGLIKNLFPVPSTAEQVAASERYTEKLHKAIEQAIAAAMESRTAAHLSIGNAQANFAKNRRPQADGPVDHRVRLLIARGDDGLVRGAAFMYACHCTTPGSNAEVSGDWAGLSAARLEQLHAGSVWLPIIGCGADANPEPRGTYDMAQQHAAELVSAIDAKIAEPQQFTPLAESAFPVAHFGYAGLAPEQPSAELIEQRQNSENPIERFWAANMLETLKEMGRLPETYPMPIHTWQFGDALTWVFLGGEVVVDYQFQLEKELTDGQTWVAAYTDDVFAYVASERMRAEGGYEVDSSMLYYSQPGRWQSGTQSLIVRRVREILEDSYSEERPLSAQQAIEATRASEGYRVDLVAAEPLVKDPINLAFGIDGRVWVVEMSDYPLGVEGGGHVKWMRDRDGDGQVDEMKIFAEGLSYPTSVMPWRDGALIIAAPDILFAHDEDGDGQADRIEPLLTGIEESNPQHRASGFDIGLDGWLHFAVGHGTKELLSHRNGKTYAVAGRDAAWNPDTGELRTTAGETQFVRGRDAFGNWFGNSNSLPMYQFVIDDRYLQHASVAGGPRQDLLTPAVAPPVYPRSRIVERFNDLFALNRFTSACSAIVIRVPGVNRDPDRTEALVCEPVHNLVARIELNPTGSVFTAAHEPDAEQFDFFTSIDPWSRPVRAINAPDGTVWIVDMVRRVIEHPEWIPTAWQERLDLRSGSQLGRIYRVCYSDYQAEPMKALTDNRRILQALASDNGARRDLALQALIQADEDSVATLEPTVRELANSHDQAAAARASALGCLLAKAWLTPDDVVATLASDDARLVRLGLTLAEHFAGKLTPELQNAINDVAARDLGLAVDLQWVLTATLLENFDAAHGLSQIAARSSDDPWILKAFSLLRQPKQALAVTEQLLDRWNADRPLSPEGFAEVEHCVSKLWGVCSVQDREVLATERLQAMLDKAGSGFTNSQLLLLSSLAKDSPASEADEMGELLSRVTDRIIELMQADKLSEAEQLTFVNLLGSGLTSSDDELKMATAFLQPDKSLQVRRTTIESLRRLRDGEVGRMLLAQWPSLNSSLRSSAGATLLSRREWAKALVEALEGGQVTASELDLPTLQHLSTYGDRELRNRCVELFGQPTERSQVVAEYLASLPSPAATPLGEKLFTEHCATCHQSVDGKPQIGPPLENLGHWTLDQWVSAILDPNKTLEPKYRQSTILTEDGEVISGLVLERNDRELLVGVSDGSVKTVPTASIADEKNAGTSLMPVGFEQKLTPEQLSELLGFLRSR
ncbi:MAG: neutral/alkaline non-lysosomal ceramidase N-terminal domain-containing protein [Pirellulaceae bacterium]